MIFTFKQQLFIFFIVFFVYSGYSQTIDSMPQKKYGIFYHFGKNAYKSVIGKSSWYYVAGIGISYGLVISGVDSKINLIAKDFGNWSTYVFAAPLLAGFVAPIVVPLSMRIFSKKNTTLKRAANAGLQAALISFSYNAILKSITGRRHPNMIENKDFIGSNDQLSKAFRFSFFQGSVYEGWPSGHAMTNMAVATAIAQIYHDKPWVKYVAYGSALTIAAGTALGIKGEIHWLSDAIAGTLMGFAIGKTIGQSFREDNTDNGKGKLSLSINGTQISLTYNF